MAPSQIRHLRTVTGFGAEMVTGFYESRISRTRKMRNHVRQLGTLGYKVTFEPRRLTTGCTLTRLRRELLPVR